MFTSLFGRSSFQAQGGCMRISSGSEGQTLGPRYSLLWPTSTLPRWLMSWKHVTRKNRISELEDTVIKCHSAKGRKSLCQSWGKERGRELKWSLRSSPGQGRGLTESSFCRGPGKAARLGDADRSPDLPSNRRCISSCLHMPARSYFAAHPAH